MSLNLIFYDLGLRLYRAGIYFASFSDPKAKKWLAGRKNILNRIREILQPDEKKIWVHCASLGEFEQGRPVIESIRKKYPGHKLVLTFFSPSGYEIRKDYDQADYVFYLPLDTRRNARIFIEMIDPQISIFVKYEYWYHYINTLKKLNRPVFLISALLRKDQVFFKWYGGLFKEILRSYTHIFVQDNESKYLLDELDIKNVTIAPDTRFDRVHQIASKVGKIPEVEEFKLNKKILVAGSTWKPDEEILSKFITNNSSMKYIIAPHEIDKEHLRQLQENLEKPYILYSRFHEEREEIGEAEVLIIDNIGMLSRLYNYAYIAYVGGGFGEGVHNTLEPAVYGIPLIFGPNHHRFKEAEDLIRVGAAFSINDFDELERILFKLLNNKEVYQRASVAAKKYIQEHIGGTDMIMERLQDHLA